MDVYGYSGLQEHVRKLRLPPLGVVENLYREAEYTVRLETSELTALCPKTGNPDYYTLIVEYVPDERILELKSFRYYLQAFRNVGIFHENLANRIFEDLLRALRPRRLKVVLRANVRGGISATVVREHQKE
ncbi:MAG: NADPH-dependent 7-cyano-7-deazaguanine reductase QueF [Thermoplasmata archaeon]|nr:MAG: NADPH-dependent 7-cyano-7-deazaguanine reductase QueF [Thermoplasmata archaeon]